MRTLFQAIGASAWMLIRVAVGGEPIPRNEPILGEAGMIALAIGLMLAGVVAFFARGRRR